jgi:hypothetical protein
MEDPQRASRATTFDAGQGKAVPIRQASDMLQRGFLIAAGMSTQDLLQASLVGSCCRPPVAADAVPAPAWP